MNKSVNTPQATYTHASKERVRCPNCGMIYPKPAGPLQAYYCARCGYSTLIPMERSSAEIQSAFAVAGALVGMGLAGVPGAIVGGLIGLLAGSGEQKGE